MNEKLEQLFNHWLTDTTDKFAEIQDRKARIDQLQYMVQTDPFVARTVDLYADEATQLDSQDTIINIETPNPRMTKDMYALLNQWGITQNRIRATIKQLAIYGDAFWANFANLSQYFGEISQPITRIKYSLFGSPIIVNTFFESFGSIINSFASNLDTT